METLVERDFGICLVSWKASSVDKEYGLGKNQVLSPLAKDFILSSAAVHIHSQQLFKYNHRIAILLNGSIFFDSVLRNRQN